MGRQAGPRSNGRNHVEHCHVAVGLDHRSDLVDDGSTGDLQATASRRFGREFTVYKFRTMNSTAVSTISITHDDRRTNHKSTDDPRHTDLGRFLRKWSLDEIPQLWNVALGDMSLIGPRPELPSIVAKYEPWQHRRHEVKPGLTGLWQVTARGDAPMHEATDIDVDYVENVRFVDDTKILHPHSRQRCWDHDRAADRPGDQLTRRTGHQIER